MAVQLREAWQTIQDRNVYPERTRRLLGEGCAAVGLFTGHAKISGRLSLQLRSSHCLRTLFAECTAQGTLRGIAQVAEGEDAPTDLRQLGGDAVLAITIENPGLDPREPQRYQSLVSMQAETLTQALEAYFVQSEQLPTRLLLAADGRDAAGLMLQMLPGDEGDSDGWIRACALFDTLGSGELLSTPSSPLLHRLFHQEQVQTLAEWPLRFGCSCSRERVAAMLASLGRDEAGAAVTDGQAEVRCEFCGQRYLFTAGQIEELFQAPAVELRAPDRLQ